VTSFVEFAEDKVREAARASFDPLVTIDNHIAAFPNLRGIGNEWTTGLYDGEFFLPEAPADVPALSLVFVQSRDGNTGADNPDALGGGPTDKHLIYEGLSRVAADAVLAGASTAAGRNIFWSVWHPELVRLRASLGLPRHPAQVVVSKDGHVDPDRTLLFNAPDVPVFVLAGAECHDRCRHQFDGRPWVTVVPIEPAGLRAALARLRTAHGIHRISAIGGRRTATSLVDAGLVQDLCLTTSPIDAGQPDTPWYAGSHPPTMRLVVSKADSRGMRVEQLMLGGAVSAY
jgi:5-amino-6-(5-phosphoribosylamino)uracil reductase